MPRLPHFSEVRDTTGSLERLRELASTHLEYARALAQSPHTPPELLEELAHRPEKGIRRALTLNPSTPETLLFKLACAFPAEFLRNPLLSLLALEDPDFAAKLPVPTRRALAKHPGTPPEMLENLVQPFDAAVRLALFANPNAPLPLLKRFRPYYQAEDSEDRFKPPNREEGLEAQILHALETPFALTAVKPELARLLLALEPVLKLRPREKAALGAVTIPSVPSAPSALILWGTLLLDASSPGTSTSRLHQLAGHPNQTVRLEVARNPSTAAPDLERLSQDLTPAVRQAVARHPNTLPTPLEHLMTDPDSRVRAALAQNSTLPLEQLETLSRDTDSSVRAGVASSLHAPPELLEKLSFERSTRVRLALSRNPHTPRAALERLLPGAPPELARAVDAHPNGAGLPTVMSELRDPATSSERLLELWKHHSLHPEIARHPNAPLGFILTWLSQASDPSVRWLSLRSSALPRPALARFLRSVRWKERLATVVHPQATYRMLRVLALDPQALVASKALERLRVEHGKNPVGAGDATSTALEKVQNPFSSWLKRVFGRWVR